MKDVSMNTFLRSQQTPNKSFMKLFGYISGANEVTAFQLYVELVQSKPNRRSHVQEHLKDEAKISMTVPVATKVTAEEEENKEGGALMK